MEEALAFGEKNDANRIYPLNVASERYPEGAPHLSTKANNPYVFYIR